MRKILITVSLTCFSSINAFDNATDFYEGFSNSEKLIAYAPADGAAKFPKVNQQSNKDRWTAAAIAAKEAGLNKPQGQADVMQIIYNRIESGNYGCNNVKQCVNVDGQFQPTFNNSWQWKSIRDINSAAKAANLSIEEIQQVDRNLQKSSLQNEAARFVKCRTDFNGESEKPYMQPHNGDITRGKDHNFFGNFYPNSGNGSCI